MDKATVCGQWPNCDICKTKQKAYADARIPLFGCWGYVCEACFKRHGCELGTGKGQILVEKAEV